MNQINVDLKHEYMHQSNQYGPEAWVYASIKTSIGHKHEYMHESNQYGPEA